MPCPRACWLGPRGPDRPCLHADIEITDDLPEENGGYPLYTYSRNWFEDDLEPLMECAWAGRPNTLRTGEIVIDGPNVDFGDDYEFFIHYVRNPPVEGVTWHCSPMRWIATLTIYSNGTQERESRTLQGEIADCSDSASIIHCSDEGESSAFITEFELTRTPKPAM